MEGAIAFDVNTCQHEIYKLTRLWELPEMAHHLEKLYIAEGRLVLPLSTFRHFIYAGPSQVLNV